MRSAAIHAALGALVLTGTAMAPSSHPAAHETPGAHPTRQTREAAGAARAADAAAAAGIDWRECPDDEGLPSYAECGEVAVPLDYAAPDGTALRLTVSRKRATGPARAHQGPLLHNPGGPGADSMSFPLYPTLRGGVWSKLNRAYDLVGYAPRGVGRSAPLRCHGPADERAAVPSVPSAAAQRALRERASAFAGDCARRYGARLARFTTADNARDLDVLRAALHRRKLTFTGTSYGAYLGAVYATLYPGHVRRLVLDSAPDPRPERIWYRDALQQSTAFQRRWGDFASWAARHQRVYGLGTTAAAVQRRFDAARAALDRTDRPGRTDPEHSPGGGAGSRGLLLGYLDAGRSAESWPRLASALADFDEGDPRALTQVAASASGSAAQRENSDAAYLAVQCSEGNWPRTWSRWARDHAALARRAPFQTWENLRTNLPCAYWSRGGAPARPVPVGPAPGRLPPVLLLASTRDGVTPYEGSVRTWRRLPGSSLVTEVGAGVHGVAGGNACADRHLAAYLLTGRTPGPAADCPRRPGPHPHRF
ncbi:alpha/beta hydrolase [Streptomyces nanshensis]|uniref:Peptidase S33 tripeptidyl aminopeptidase-like C-terminal domain-containing protein n=1 Tax=Streptomyces nanshensis TaxID=518642 RepID=A0A1E7KXR5_9ACTN|nr:alpha/beta hydrolase [Streptomyces nanshensis]OEV08613.1 hypothetical protein AN218_25790 [Streptomyces nanshensis]